MPPRIFPATDLNLLVGAVVPLRVFAPTNNVWTDFSTLPGFATSLEPAGGATASIVNHQITALAVGSLLTALRVDVGVSTFKFAMRITVHHRIRQILLPQPSITLETDRSDRILSVYAQFETAGGALSTHDVTAHPYLRYDIALISGAPTVAVDQATGRITSGPTAGSVRITVRADPALAPGGPTGSFIVNVVAAPAERPILKRVHEGAAIRKRSVVVLSEGFTQQQQQMFETLAGTLARRMVRRLSPYTLLRESFDLYTAFVPSQEPGCTLGPPIVPLGGSADVAVPVPPDQALGGTAAHPDYLVEELLAVLGNPATNAIAFAAAGTTMQAAIPGGTLTQLTFDTWRALATPRAQPRIRETYFGFIIGERHYGTATDNRGPGPMDVALDFLRPREANRTPQFDDRRLPDLTAAGADPSLAHLAAQDRFVRTLRAPDGPAGQGAVWAHGGDSFGLVVYLVNADHYGGVRLDGYLAMSIGGGFRVATAPSLLAVGLTDVEPVPRPILGASYARGFRVRPLDSLVDTMAHELAHAVALGELGDEYGGRAQAPPDAVARAFVEKGPNTQLLANARTGAAIRGDLLKWNWERVEGSANVEGLLRTGAFLELTLVTEDMTRWPDGAVGRAVFLRAKTLATVGQAHSANLTVRSVDRAAHHIRIEAASEAAAIAIAAAFPAGSTLVLPRLDAASAVMRLVHPSVIAAMSAGPFAASAAGCTPSATQAPPAAVPGFAFPANRLQTLAAYESAAQFNCGTLRPAAECKMRRIVERVTDQPVDFCFACKYAMVEAVDCGAHGELDKEYPR